MASKPIRVFWSPLGQRFFASAHYRVNESTGVVTITGRKYDVTQDIAAAIVENEIEFSRATSEEVADG